MGYRMLLLSRFVWQFGIIILYTFGAVLDWEKASLTVGGAIFLGTNLLLGMFLDDIRWQKVRKWALVTEEITALLLTLLLLYISPLGPACLLILPTLVTYSWLFDRDKIQWSIAWDAALLFVLTIRWVDKPPHRPSYFGISINEAIPSITLGLYGAILSLGLLLAFLFQIQKHKNERLAEAMHRVEKQSKQLVKVNQQVSEYANEVYELATAEERNRIAGEIHDTVAHRLTALLVQLQAARRRLTTEAEVYEIAENLEVCEALARESLDEVRFSVRAIRRRSTDVEGLDVLRRLIGEYSTLTSMDIRFIAEPTVHSLPTQVLALLYRVLQESLTNAQRHGRATEVKVSLERVGLHLVLQVADNGRGTPSMSLGFGLSSMQDRVRQLGGDITSQSSPGSGYTLRLKLPVWEGV